MEREAGSGGTISQRHRENLAIDPLPIGLRKQKESGQLHSMRLLRWVEVNGLLLRTALGVGAAMRCQGKMAAGFATAFG